MKPVKLRSMWSSLEKLLSQFPDDRFVIVEHGEPRYVLLSFDAYRTLRERGNEHRQIEPEKKEEDAEHVNEVLSLYARQEVGAHETEQIQGHEEPPVAVGDTPKENSWSEPLPETQREFRPMAISIDDLPL